MFDRNLLTQRPSEIPPPARGVWRIEARSSSTKAALKMFCRLFHCKRWKCFLVVFAIGLAPASSLADIKQVHLERLKALKDDLNEKRAALRNLHSEEKSLILLIGDLDQSLARVWTSHEEAVVRQEELVGEMKILQAQLDADQEAFTDVSSRLQKRLRSIYVLGKHGAIRHLFGAESFQDLTFRRAILNKVAKNDVSLVNRRAQILRVIEKRRAALGGKLEEAQLISAQIKEQADLLQTTRVERAATISLIQDKKDLAMRAVRDIVSEQKNVKHVLFRLLKEKNSKRGYRRLRRNDALKLGLRWPVQGQIIRVYGITRDKNTGAKWVSNGLHIRARLGTPLSAPGDGEIVFVGWLRGFGQLVILDHGDGIHSLLGHLSRAIVEVGEIVSRGQTIGFTGDTGSFDGPKLYFELRSRGKPLNPLRYLKE